MNQPVNNTARKNKQTLNNTLYVFMFGFCTMFGNQAIANSWLDDISGQFFIQKMIDDKLAYENENDLTTEWMQSLSCYGIIHVSLDADGIGIITPDEMLLSGSVSNSIVLINNVANDTLDCDDVGKTVIVKVLDTLTNESCWGQALIEDKLPPVIVCDTAFFYCTRDPRDPNLITAPDTVYDNCGINTITFNDGIFTAFNCDPTTIYAGSFTRTWTVTDHTGRQASCDQLVLFRRVPLDSIILPANDTMYCPSYNLDPSVTGQPTFQGDTLLHTCNILSYYRDIKHDGKCDGEFKVIRQWTVMDYCTDMVRNVNQKIMVFDTAPPILTCPDTLIISTSQHTCSASYTIPEIIAYDSCSHDNLVIIVEVSTHPGVYTPGQIVTLDLGTHVLHYTVYDDCGNSATCDIVVIVKDLVDPELSCTTITIPLGSSPLTTRLVGDAGIITLFDNCGIDSIAFRRISSNCNVPRDTIFGDTLSFCCADVGQTVIVEYLVIDESGNRNICWDSVIVKPPVIFCEIIAPPDTTIICNSPTDTMALGSATVSNCVLNPVINFSDVTAGGPCTSTITRTWSTTDVCGDTITDVQIITIVDTIPPIIVDCPHDTTLSCDMLDNLSGTIVVTDNCTPTESITISSITIPDGFVDGILIRWYVRDFCGNVDSCDQEITIVDTEPPTILCPDSIEVFIDADTCAATVAIPLPETDDNCGVQSVINDYTMTNDASGVYPLGTTTVVFIVTDLAGLKDTCEFTVTVIDNAPPVIEDLNDTTVICEINLDDLSIFGTPGAIGNCDPDDSITIEESAIRNIDASCGTGTITRTFIATDTHGNMDTSEQIITVEASSSFGMDNIVCPEDSVIVNDCSAGTSPSDLGSMVMLIDTAGLSCYNGVEVEFLDTPTSDPNFCVAISRVWTITDVCQNIATPGMGTFTCTQLILINPDSGPTFTFAPNFSTTLLPGICDVFIIPPLAAAVGCGAVTITNDSPFAISNGADIRGTYPIGETVITFTATDACGFQSTVQRTVTIMGAGEFEIVCRKTIVNIQSNGQVTVSPISFVDEVLNACPVGFPVTLSFSADVTDITRVFTCADVNGGLIDITVFATDINGIQVSCTDGLADVNDIAFCPTALVNLGGQLKTALGNMNMPNVEVILNESDEFIELTNNSGHYMFEEIQTFGQAELAPYRDGDFTNGINTLDLINIHRHILNLDNFDNPYHYIAADVNADKSIDVLDLISLQDAILFEKKKIDENTSWRFIDEDYTFSNPTNPLIEDYPESQIYTDLLEDHMDNNFLAVKIGDVNGTAQVGFNSVASRSSNSLKVNYELADKLTNKLVLSFTEPADIDGYQLKIRFDSPLDLNVNVSVGQGENNVGIMRYELIDEYTLAIVFARDQVKNYKADESILEISNFHNGEMSNIISVDIDEDFSEAYSNGLVHKLIIAPRSEEGKGLRLYQNYPNPFTDETIISYILPSDDVVALSIYDIAGKIIYQRTYVATKGLNLITLRSDELIANGLLYYELKTSDTRVTRRMLSQE